jgi:hypothetical protein
MSQEQDVLEVPLLQDISHYLHENGILPGHLNAPAHEPYQQQDQVELEATVNAQQEYQTEIINKFIKDDEEISIKSCEESTIRKKTLLEKCKGISISIKTRDSLVVKNMPLDMLVDQCDTFLTLVGSEHWSSFVNQDFVFELNQFQKEAVEHFLEIIQIRDKSSILIRDFITSNFIIECCYIAHYLQATDVLNEIVSVIQSSIDSENCTSICVLADELQIPSLLQASMKFVMERLDHIKNDVEVWNSIPSTLRNQIIALNKAVKSSIIGRGQTKEAIFSSVEEFIAILNDTLNCHKERLREAKERQEEIIEDRLREGRVISGSGRFVQEKDVLGGSVADAAKKIKRQEERVNTLQAFYNEQKAIFAKDRQSVEQFQGMFQL